MSLLAHPKAWLAVALVTLVAAQLPLVDAAGTPIQPGVRVDTSSGQCTANFVFDGQGAQAGKVYIGTAAHCVSSVGQTATLAGNLGAGRVAYMGDIPSSVNSRAQDNGIAGTQGDFALIEITSNAPVHAEVLGHPGMPTGFTTDADTTWGDRLLLSGHGLAFRWTEQTREDREGMLVGDTYRDYQAYLPIINGDSGGPLLHGSGKALGVISAFGPTGSTGPTIEVSLDEARAAGVDVVLRTA